MASIFDYELSTICCGCRSCESACRKQCISCEESSEDGFIYPVLNNPGACVDCGLCIKSCPILSIRSGIKPLSCVSISSKNPIASSSASGGVFATLADKIISNNGVVYGCAFDENIEALTIRVDDIKQLPKLLSSKYVLCDTRDSFKRIKKDLSVGNTVLYCSTPCQVAALKNYLMSDYSNLITIDLFCHGVPSPGLFRKYRHLLEKKYKHKISEFVFRDKAQGWGTIGYYVIDKKRSFRGDIDPFYWNFLKSTIYQKSCYNCPYAKRNRVGDISIGDFWGVEKEYPSIDVRKGVSAVLVNSPIGKELILGINNCSDITNIEFESISKYNAVVCSPTKYNKKRDLIYEAYNKTSDKQLFKKYVNLPYSKFQLFKKKIVDLMFKYKLGGIANIFFRIKRKGERK